MPTPTRSDLFGVPLEDIMGYEGEKGGIPRVVKDAIQFLRDTGEPYLSLIQSSLTLQARHAGRRLVQTFPIFVSS